MLKRWSSWTWASSTPKNAAYYTRKFRFGFAVYLISQSCQSLDWFYVKHEAHGCHTEGMAVTFWCVVCFFWKYFQRRQAIFILDVVLSIPKLMHVGLALLYECFPMDALRTFWREWVSHAWQQNADAIHTVALGGVSFLFNVLV